MKIRWNYIFPMSIFLVMGIQACSSSRNSSAQEQQTATASSPQALPPAAVNLAPGVVRIVATPIAIQQKEAKIFCVLKVEQILGYGMSTPPITIGSEVQTDMGNFQNQQLEQFKSAVQQQSKITLTLQTLPGGAMEEKRSGWKIIDIDKITAK